MTGYRRTPYHKRFLIEVLQDEDGLVRATAARALGKIGPEAERAVPALMRAIQDQVMIVRMGAAMGLGGIGPKAKEAIPVLAEALQSQNEDHKLRVEFCTNSDIQARDKKGRMPLHYAAGANSTDLVELLLTKGTDINAEGWQGWTAPTGNAVGILGLGVLESKFV